MPCSSSLRNIRLARSRASGARKLKFSHHHTEETRRDIVYWSGTRVNAPRGGGAHDNNASDFTWIIGGGAAGRHPPSAGQRLSHAGAGEEFHRSLRRGERRGLYQRN